METLFTLEEVLELNPDLNEQMVRNYRFNSKNKIGRKINKKLYFSEKDIDKMLNITVKYYNRLRDKMFNFLKNHPCVPDKMLHLYLRKYDKKTGWSKDLTSKILADLSDEDCKEKYCGLYEDENGFLFIEGYEQIKKRTKKTGFFYEKL